jgi:hypothetical protein
VNQSQDP